MLVVAIPSEPVLELVPTGRKKFIVEISPTYLTLRLPTRGQAGRTFVQSGATSFRGTIGLTEEELRHLGSIIGVGREISLFRKTQSSLCFRIKAVSNGGRTTL